jgi:Zn-dependent peptidase ImmA (M78 family)
MVKTHIPIQHEVLVWARQRRGYDIETAAGKLDLKTDQLRALESGGSSPTPAQIRHAADVYLVSPAVFFLPEAPSEGFEAPRDFRTIDSSGQRAFSPALRKEIERVRAQRTVLTELLSDGLIDETPIDFVVSPQAGVESTAAQLRAWLGIEEQLHRVSSPDKILQTWIAAIEKRGILVAQVSRIPTSEMRGLCIAQRPFPMIVLNGGDGAAPRLFSLVHELTHALLREDSVCNDPTADGNTEAFCNALAAAVIIPRESLLARPPVAAAPIDKAWSLDDLGELAKPFGVSREAMLRRLLTLKKTTPEHYKRTRALLNESYRLPAKAKQSGGPPTAVLLLRNLGETYVRSVITARNRGYITDSRLADYIFAKLQHAGGMAEQLGMPLR